MTKQLQTAILTALAVFLFAFVAYRAFNLSFTHDESFTYTRYIDGSFMEILNYGIEPHLPNNHILNTFGMKYFEMVFGSEPWVLRLPNLMAYTVFLLFSVLWFRKFSNPVVACCGFIVLHFNPYLLDFFSLARGYGMSFSLMFVSFYFFDRFRKSLNPKDSVKAFVIGALAVLANFTVLNFFLALLAVSFIGTFAKRKRNPELRLNFWKANLPAILTFIGLFIVCYEPMRKLKKWGGLFGGESSFWQDTVMTLSQYLSYRPETVTSGTSVIAIAISVVAVIALLTAIFDLRDKRWQLFKSPLAISSFCLFIPVLSTIVQHLLLGNQYLEERTALFFFPLFCINSIVLLKWLAERKGLYQVGNVFAFIFAGVFLIHFIQKANLTHTLNWNYDAQTAEILEDIEQMEFSSIAPQGCIMLGVDPHLEPTINFYKKTRDYHWINDIPLDGYYDSLSYDYKVFIKSELPAFAKDWLRLKEYQTAETILYK